MPFVLDPITQRQPHVRVIVCDKDSRTHHFTQPSHWQGSHAPGVVRTLDDQYSPSQDDDGPFTNRAKTPAFPH